MTTLPLFQQIDSYKQNNVERFEEEAASYGEDYNRQQYPNGNESNKTTTCKKVVVGCILLLIVILVIADSLTNQHIANGLRAFLQWIEDNPISGFFAFVLAYLVATVLFVPASILTLGAGFIFVHALGLFLGVIVGTAAVFLGASSGAIASFFIGRFLLRDWITELAKKYPVLEALDAAFEEKGLYIMVLLRLSPLIPFNVMDYIAGVTALSFRNYVLSMFAIVPGAILYVFLGGSAGSLAETASSSSAAENRTMRFIVIASGVLFGILAVGMASYHANAQLQRIIEDQRRTQQATESSNSFFLSSSQI